MDFVNNKEQARPLTQKEKLLLASLIAFFVTHTAFISGCVLSILDKEPAGATSSTQELVNAMQGLNPNQLYADFEQSLDFGEP